jgi:hypothetical protein
MLIYSIDEIGTSPIPGSAGVWLGQCEAIHLHHRLLLIVLPEEPQCCIAKTLELRLYDRGEDVTQTRGLLRHLCLLREGSSGKTSSTDH